ncbi:hypothetical protein [Roseovarius salis]|uniref:hypothetical protein n=1 Tax=Roseovarius salis TaxID=3376063 RepID=UPI0037CA5265
MATRVICYSLTGATRTVCLRVADHAGAELHQIRAPRVRAGMWGMLRWGVGTLLGHATPVIGPDTCWRAGDTVILGAPVWAGRVAVPMVEWLRAQPPLPPKVGLVMTSGQTRLPGAAFDRFAAVAGVAAAATLHVCERDARARRFDDRIKIFLDRLEETDLPTARAPGSSPPPC